MATASGRKYQIEGDPRTFVLVGAPSAATSDDVHCSYSLAAASEGRRRCRRARSSVISSNLWTESSGKSACVGRGFTEKHIRQSRISVLCPPTSPFLAVTEL